MLNQLAASSNVGLQLGWKSAGESFSIAAGNVTNPGESARAITPDDTFNYGSGTKAVIATAVMRMVDAGKLKLDDKVSTYVDPFLKRNNGTTLEQLFGSALADATVLHVIRMEAGIPDFEGHGNTIDGKALHSHDQIFSPYVWMRAASKSSNNTPMCSPGSCSAYSSTSYEVAGLLLAAVQNPDGDYNDLDFTKAISGNSPAPRYPSIKLPGSHGKLKDTMSVSGISGSGVVLWEQNPTIMGWSCGGMNANTLDFARFFYDLLDEASPNPLVSSAAREEMTRIKPLTAGHFKVDYGAGLMDFAPPRYNKPTGKGPKDWGYVVGHIGETFGFHAINGYMPKAKAAISIVTNSDGGRHLTGIAACKAAEVAAKVLSGIKTMDLGCTSTDHRRRRRKAAEVSDIIV